MATPFRHLVQRVVAAPSAGMIIGGLYVLTALRAAAVSGVTPATQRTSTTAGRTA